MIIGATKLMKKAPMTISPSSRVLKKDPTQDRLTTGSGDSVEILPYLGLGQGGKYSHRCGEAVEERLVAPTRPSHGAIKDLDGIP